MVLQQKNGIEFFQSPSFLERGLLCHGFSTRWGGVSEAPFQSLNLAFHNGDDWEKVKKNRRIFTEALGIEGDALVAANQVHGDTVYFVQEEDRGRGAMEEKTAIDGVDGLITNKKGVALIAFFADCVPLMFFDPIKKAIAISHAGWKGTCLRIGAKTVQRMVEEFQTDLNNLLVIIGPSIGPCHYQVDQKVIENFQKGFPNWSDFIQLEDGGKGNGQLDLWQANKLELIALGVPEDNITSAEICTYCHPELFYSYRYDHGQTGRLAAVISLD